MDVTAFLDRVDSVFDGDPLEGGRPTDPVFDAIVEQVAGYTSAHELAVLNLAARLLPADEVYLEVGTYKGRSICGAVQGVTDRTFVLSENYLEFGMLGQDARDELHGNLERHARHVDVQLLEGDCFSTLVQPGVIRRPVGVYFYDGKHTRLSHYLALGVVEPLLADEALVLVDDATWPVVQAAHADYLGDHPGWSVVRRWDAKHNGDPAWANGLHALRWQRPVDRAAGLDRKVRARRLAQVGVVGPAESVAWHALHRFPALVPIASRLYPKKSSAIA
jgi:hypothetical protein